MPAKEMWVVVVDGMCYGFFDSRMDAVKWARESYPIAYHQGRAIEYEFVSIVNVYESAPLPLPPQSRSRNHD